MGTSTPLKDRLEAIRARKAQVPRIVRLYPSKPTSLSPYVRMARARKLTPTLLNGAWTPAGSDTPA